MQIVKFLKTAIPHYEGEIAGLQDDKAADFKERGLVEFLPMKQITFTQDYHSYKNGLTYNIAEFLADEYIKLNYCIEKKGVK